MAATDPTCRPVVLHVLEAVRGGTSRHVADVVATAAGIAHHVAVPPEGRAVRSSGALPDEAAVAAMLAAGAVVHRVDMRRSALSPVNLAGLARLRRLIGRLGPVAVHGHSSVGGALARLAAASAAAPAVYTPNGLATGPGALAVERALAPLTAALVAASASEAELARRLRLARADRIHNIPNGIDLTEPLGTAPDLRTRLGLAPGTPLVGTIARLVPQKSPLTFVAVCARVALARPDAAFVLVGMGPLQSDVDAAVCAFGLRSRFHQIGHLPAAAAVVGQLDVFVLASAFEGGPYAPLEAMRAGVPVVLSDVVGNADVVLDEVTGLLFPLGDTEAMGDAVVGLLADPPRVARLAAAAAARLTTTFDRRIMGEALAGLYLEVGTRRRRIRRLPTPSASSSQRPDASASEYNS